MSEEVQTPETPAAVEQTPDQPVKIIGDDGNFTQEFRDSLPDDLGKHSSFDKYSSAIDYFKGAINSAKLNGQKAEEFYTSEDPDIIARRNKIMGVPEDVSGYEYDPVDFAEGMPVDIINERIDAFKAFAKENNMPASFVKKAIEFDLNGANEEFVSMQEAQKAVVLEEETKLRREWKGNKFQYNTDKAKNALHYLGLEDYIEDLNENMKFRKDVFDKIVPLISDDTIIEARQSHNMATLSDSLDAHQQKMIDYVDGGGDMNSSTYKGMIEANKKLLGQLSNK